MQISILNPVFQTNIFIIVFVMLVLVTIKRSKNAHTMSAELTQELKGIAILMVIFCHIGYFLFRDNRFLFPLSIGGGVGVNIFLFLSGFGLTMSALSKPFGRLAFYKKRLPLIFVPMWLVIAALLLLDFFVLHRTYSLYSIIPSFLGIFSIANVFTSINSPLRYFTWILFYYMCFPLVFSKRFPLFSAVLIYILGVTVIKLNIPITPDVVKLYGLHTLAFPLGTLFAYGVTSNVLHRFFTWVVTLFPKNTAGIMLSIFLRYLFIALFLYIFGYTAIHSGVGESLIKEQFLSIVTMICLLAFALLKTFSSRFLILFGIYSYEIYLVHWVLLSRYDFVYKQLPAGIGTLLYLGIFIVLGMLLNILTKWILYKKV